MAARLLRKTAGRSWPENRAHTGSAARPNALGLAFEQYTHLTGLPVRILVHAEVFLGHFIDVFGGALLRHFDHAPADAEIAIGIVRIHDGERYSRVALHVAVLDPSPRAVKPARAGRHNRTRRASPAAGRQA